MIQIALDLRRDNGPTIRAHIALDLAYLEKLCERGKELGWPKDDPLLAPARRARDAMERLGNAARYAGGAHAGDRADQR